MRAHELNTAELTPDANAPAAVDRNVLERLCRYYLDCINHDDQGGVSVFAASKHDPNYAELARFPGISGKEVPTSADAQAIVRKAARDRNRLSLQIGYPVLANRIKARSGWEGFILEPLCLFALQEATGTGALPPLVDEPPALNFKAIRTLVGANQASLADELVQLAEEIGLANSANLLDVRELMQALRAAREHWPWRESTAPEALALEPPLAAVSEPGIYNRAILIATERSPYTKGLETELATLRKTSLPDCCGTALGAWLESAIPPADSLKASALLEPIPLNTEQRQAVQSALTNQLTVITGPPGTGKSQVVTSILVNAAWQGMRVLFASKNNRAVDVVETRVNALGSRPVLLRLGGNETQSRLPDYLSGLLAITATRADAEEYEELSTLHARLAQQLDRLDQRVENTVALRNTVDRLDQQVDALRSEIGDERFRALRGTDPATCRGFFDQLSFALRRADRRAQPWLVRPFWRYLKQERHDAFSAAASAARASAESLGIALPSAPSDGASLDGWYAAVERLAARLDALAAVPEYFAALEALNRAEPLERISAERYSLVEQLARNSSELWKLWLRLQPGRLTPAERKILSDYSSLVQLMAGSRDEGGTRLSKQVDDRYHELFPRVTRTLSCWAVTSLSARGRLPLQPGFFDLLVIDEASQCDIASAIPLLYRAKRAVIIGDPNQLKHISAVSPAQDQRLLAKHELLADHIGWSYATKSLFDRAASLAASRDIVDLRDHHRSHADIVGFSNEKFYGGRLRVATHYDRLRPPSREAPAVRWIQTRGPVVRPASGGAMSHAEAKGIAAELRRLVLEQGYRGSIGVVSPFRAQTNFIRDLIQSDDDLASRLAGSDLLVDTVHRFQGDERDLMIFSPTVAHEMPQGAVTFLQRTPNLFNVAITRARSALVIVGDMDAASSVGVDYLAEFANYVQRLGKEQRSGTGRTSTFGPEYPRVARPEQVSDWERLLYRALYDAGVKTIPQYPVEQYTLDLALLTDEHRLDIEVDGERYHRSWDGELARRDQLRNQRLIELGWDVMRFWVYQLRDDMAGCVARVRAWSERGAS